MKEIQLYTDGACSGNPGVGGYGIVLIFNDYIKEFSGVNPSTTNNRMEITAVIEGLRKIKQKCKVTIFTDSAYTMNAINEGWIDNWLANNWRTANKREVKNGDLWQDLLVELSKHEVKWEKVKGHSDNKFNNRCDELARKEITNFQKNINV